MPLTVSREYVLAAPRSLQPRDRELPPLADGWARLRFLYCGICGSDLSTFEGRREVSYPVSLGHEFIAEVAEVGNGVDRLAAGAIVTSDLNYRCGSCDQCLAGRSHLCREGRSGAFSNRAFAELGDIHTSYLTRLDGDIQAHLALTEPLSCVLHAREWGEPRVHERVLVIGAGGLGACMAFALCGKDQPISFDITDEMTTRLDLVATTIEGVGRAVAQPEGEYDVVFDLSGSVSGLQLACSHTKRGGRLCTMSHLDGVSNCDFLLASLTRRDVTFIVSYLNGERRTMDLAANMLETDWTPGWNRLVEVVPIDKLQEAFETRRLAPWCKTLVEVASKQN